MTIEDLQIILGPVISFASHQENFIMNNDEEESYDMGNAFNIHEHMMRFSFKGKCYFSKSADPEEKKKETEEGSSKDKLKLILKNVTLKINRIHIRFEDDYYASQRPFAFGIICDVIIETSYFH